MRNQSCLSAKKEEKYRDINVEHLMKQNESLACSFTTGFNRKSIIVAFKRDNLRQK